MAITDAATALNVINTAIQHRAHPGPAPDTDAAKIQLANELMVMAETAKAAGVTAAAVPAVLQAGAPTGQAAPVPPQDNPFGNAPAPAPAPVPQQQAIPTPPPAPTPAPIASQPSAAPPVAAAPTDINQLIPNYDEQPKDQILAYLASFTPEQVEIVKAYEASEGERAFVAQFQPQQAAAPAQAAPAPAAPAPDPALGGPVAFNTVAIDQEASTEPFNGYATAKIKDIVAVIEGALGTHPDPKSLFRHIWAFEKAGKDRTSLFKKLEEVAKNGVQSTPAPAAAPVPVQAPPVAPQQPDVHPEHPFGLSNQQAAPAAAPAPAPVASAGPSTEFGGDLAAPIQGSTQKAEAHVTSEFPLPDPQNNIPSIPEDFSALSDLQVRQYASKFNAVQARLIVLLAKAKGHVADAINVADDAEQKYIREWAGDPKATVKTQEAHAANTAEVSTARHTAREWQGVVRYYEALVTVYDLTCKRLSREQTSRYEEKVNSQ